MGGSDDGGAKIITSDLFNLIPMFKGCYNSGQKQSSGTELKSQCPCTGPSRCYTKPCKINSSTTDHAGRATCYYGDKPNCSSDGDRNNSTNGTSAGGSGLLNSKGTYSVNGVPFTTPGQAPDSNRQKYPMSFLFCQDTGAGGTSSSPLIKTLDNLDNWNKSNPARPGEKNLGFDVK